MTNQLIEQLGVRRDRLAAIAEFVQTNDDAVPGFARLFHWKKRAVQFLKENVSEAEADDFARSGRSTGLPNYHALHSEVKLYDAILLAIIEALEDDPNPTLSGNATVLGPTKSTTPRGARGARTKYKYDVFISYSSLDQEQANEMYEAITTAGKKAFLSAKDLKPGEDFADAIRSQLKSSRELWLIVSPNSLKSEWVLTEWGAAWALSKKIVPILYRCKPDDLPERLRRLHSIDFHKYQQLIAHI
jgi:hypothetical protein